LTMNGFAKSSSSGNRSSGLKAKPQMTKGSQVSLRDSMPEHRYVGAFGVEGWATRSGVSSSSFTEALSTKEESIKSGVSWKNLRFLFGGPSISVKLMLIWLTYILPFFLPSPRDAARSRCRSLDRID